jgi:hypothetical protein
MILKQITTNVSKRITFTKSPAESSRAPIIFLRPGSFETDLNGLNSRKLRRADKLGNTGITETMLQNI